MMHPNDGFSNRRNGFGQNRMTECRRIPGRMGMPDRGAHPYGTPPFSVNNQGCGCGLGQPAPRSCGCGQNRGGEHPTSCRCGHDHDHHEHGAPAPQPRNQDISARSKMPSGRCDGGLPHGSCERLMDQIRAVDFALYETILYLDVYPHSCDALETYHKLKAQKEALHREYEAAHGPLTAFGNQSETTWDWINQPFPWEYDAD